MLPIAEILITRDLTDDDDQINIEIRGVITFLDALGMIEIGKSILMANPESVLPNPGDAEEA